MDRLAYALHERILLINNSSQFRNYAKAHYALDKIYYRLPLAMLRGQPMLAVSLQPQRNEPAMTREDQIRAFLASKGATVCPPTSSHKDNAKSLRYMRNMQEAGQDPFNLEDDEPEDDIAEREAFGRARSAGFSVSDALDEARDARNRSF